MSIRSGIVRRDVAARRFTLLLHVQPGARRSEIVGRHGDALKIRVAAPAVDNKANSELIDFLSRALGVQKSAIVIRRGASARRKLVEITGGAEIADGLRALESSAGTVAPPRIGTDRRR